MPDAWSLHKAFLGEHPLRADKKMGQHFLHDRNIARKIATSLSPDPDSMLLEIGPGPGSLTLALLETHPRLLAIEADRRMHPYLAHLDRLFPGALQVIYGDARTFSLHDLQRTYPASAWRIAANLPFCISVPWLLHRLMERPCRWKVMVLMFQKEVATRILASPGTRAYGRLSVMAQALSVPVRFFSLPGAAFSPPPKVDSTVVTFTPVTTDDTPVIAWLETLCRHAFSQRRKMLRSSLAPLLQEKTLAIMAELNIDARRRAETLLAEEYLRAARYLLNRLGPPPAFPAT